MRGGWLTPIRRSTRPAGRYTNCCRASANAWAARLFRTNARFCGTHSMSDFLNHTRSAVMCQLTRPLKATAVIVLTAGSTIAGAAEDDSHAQRNAYVVAPLVSNVSGGATAQDTVLRNAWGVAFSPAGSPFWVNDNGTGCSTLYSGDGTKLGLQVSIPLPGNVVPAASCHPVDPNNPPNPAPAAPTGIVWNPSTAFLVPGTKLPAAFIFATEDGTVSAWAGGLNPADNAVIAIDNSSSPAAGNGAVYKGLVFGLTAKGGFLYATNFRAGTIDVFGPTGSDGLFTSAATDGSFADPNIPAGYAPFGIANIDGDLFVTYAKQNAEKHDDVAGPGRGFVDVFDTDGRIDAFDNDGRFIDELDDAHGKPLVIDGLWTLTLGGGRGSSSDTLYFTAGPNGESDGLFGNIVPAP